MSNVKCWMKCLSLFPFFFVSFLRKSFVSDFRRMFTSTRRRRHELVYEKTTKSARVVSLSAFEFQIGFLRFSFSFSLSTLSLSLPFVFLITEEIASENKWAVSTLSHTRKRTSRNFANCLFQSLWKWFLKTFVYAWSMQFREKRRLDLM